MERWSAAAATAGSGLVRLRTALRAAASRLLSRADLPAGSRLALRRLASVERT